MPLGPQSPLPGPTSPSLRTPCHSDRLEALLADLGPSLHRGVGLPASFPNGTMPFRACGLPAIDDLIGGGFAADRLSEITGPASSGRTSIALALLTRTTRWHGELAAVVDLADAFDPASAEAAGVDLDRVLWARAGAWREALISTERVLETEGIPVVILDLSPPSPAAVQPTPTRRQRGTTPRRGTRTMIPVSAWTRLARLAQSTRTALVVLSSQRLTGARAQLVLEMRPPRPRFTGLPPLLEEIVPRAVLVRRQGGPPFEEEDEQEVSLRIQSG